MGVKALNPQGRVLPRSAQQTLPTQASSFSRDMEDRPNTKIEFVHAITTASDTTKMYLDRDGHKNVSPQRRTQKNCISTARDTTNCISTTRDEVKHRKTARVPALTPSPQRTSSDHCAAHARCHADQNRAWRKVPGKTSRSHAAERRSAPAAERRHRHRTPKTWNRR